MNILVSGFRFSKNRVDALPVLCVLAFLIIGIPITLASPPEPVRNNSDGVVIRSATDVAIESYTVRRGLKSVTERARFAREQLKNLPPDIMAAAPITTGAAVSGKFLIPVVPVTFIGESDPPYGHHLLQQQLFDGPWPTGTMKEHYSEMSRNVLELDGTVTEWTNLAQSNEFYSGQGSCNGICKDAEIPRMISTTISQLDETVNFGQFDNDGPDQIPNSGDDDGFVDFIAFVQPKTGGECLNNKNIWSHRYAVSQWGGSAVETEDVSKNGGGIFIDDYVVVPALACDGVSMIQIGVFSHEFGHAFGLPDLYNTVDNDASAGAGGWELMASGSWGGEGSGAPEIPSHMSAWSKEYLGWISPRVITHDTMEVVLNPILSSGEAVRLDYSLSEDPEDDRYLLLEFRTKNGFDRSIAASGLLITEVTNTIVSSGLTNNRVNANPAAPGVNIIEADGLRQLDGFTVDKNEGDAGDVFPGGENVTHLDSASGEGVRAAICNIKQGVDSIGFDVYTDRTICPSTPLANIAISPSKLLTDGYLIGAEVVVQGKFVNEGTNLFTDRKFVLKDESSINGKILVTAPTVFSAAIGGMNTQPTIADLEGKNIIARGKIEKIYMKGSGLQQVLVIDEYELNE